MSKPPWFEPKPEEPRPRGPRFTIGQLMIVIAATAAFFSIQRMLNSPLRTVPLAAAGILTALMIGSAVIEAAFGRICPVCSRRAL